MHSKSLIAALTGAVIAALAACGGSSPDAANPTSEPSTTAAPTSAPTTEPTSAPTAAPTSAPTAAPSAAPVALPTTWSDDMPKEQQAQFMMKNVMPAMSKVFADHDAKRYKDFGCQTCHGPDRKNPHDFLPHLTLKGDKIVQFATKAAISKWMGEAVTPAMATAMGEPAFDPKTHKGFGCGGCHTIDTK